MPPFTMPGQFPDPVLFGQTVVKIAQNYAAQHVSRGTAPEQISNYLEVCGLPRDPSISFCAAGGSYSALHAYCDLAGIFYSAQNAVQVFRRYIPVVEQHWIKISASCEEVRQWAIAHGRWTSIDDLGEDVQYKPGWVALLNFETPGPEAHHYAIITGDAAGDEVPTVEFNTSDVSQGHGGCVAVKRRLLTMPQFRGIVRTY